MGIPIWRDTNDNTKPHRSSNNNNHHNSSSSSTSPLRTPIRRRHHIVARFVQAAIRASGRSARDASSEQILLTRLVNEIFDGPASDSRNSASAAAAAAAATAISDFRDSDVTNEDEGDDLEDVEIFDREPQLRYSRLMEPSPSSSFLAADGIGNRSSSSFRRLDSGGLADEFRRFASIPPISDPSSSTTYPNSILNYSRNSGGNNNDNENNNNNNNDTGNNGRSGSGRRAYTPSDRLSSAGRHAQVGAYLQSFRERQQRFVREQQHLRDEEDDVEFLNQLTGRRQRRSEATITGGSGLPSLSSRASGGSGVGSRADRVLRGEREARVRELVNVGSNSGDQRDTSDRSIWQPPAGSPYHYDRLAAARAEIERYSNRDRSVRFG